MALIKEMKTGKLRVKVFDTRNAMGEDAGKEATACIRQLLKEKEEINIIFAAAPSQNETLETLIKEPGIEWERINAYHMDEYVGLEPEDPAGFRNYLNRTIFEKLPFKTINLINGNVEDAYAEAERYGELLKIHPVDICLLGVGENGHLAFNDPGVAKFDDSVRAKVVPLDEVCRQQQVNDGCFEKIDEVPTHAITVTIPGLTAAKYMFCSVPAATKARAIKDMLSGEVTEKCPASILTEHEAAVLYLDKDSSAMI